MNDFKVGVIGSNVDLQKISTLKEELTKITREIDELVKKLLKLKEIENRLARQLVAERNKNSFSKTHLQTMKLAQKHLV